MLGSCVPSVTMHTVGEEGREGGSVGRCVRASVGRTSVVAVGWLGREGTHPPTRHPPVVSRR